MAKLTPKQEKFCKFYLLNGGNGTQAAIAAGCSKRSASSTAHRMLRNDEILKRLKSAQQTASNKYEYTFNSYMKDLDEAIKLSKQTAALTPLLKAIELKGKACGLSIEKHEVSGSISFNTKWGESNE